MEYFSDYNTAMSKLAVAANRFETATSTYATARDRFARTLEFEHLNDAGRAARDAELLRPVLEAEESGDAVVDEAEALARGIETFANSAPALSDADQARAANLALFVREDVERARTGADAVAMIDAALVVKDRVRLWLLVRYVEQRIAEGQAHDPTTLDRLDRNRTTGPSFDSRALREALDRARGALVDPTRAKAAEHARQLRERIDVTRTVVGERRTTLGAMQTAEEIRREVQSGF